MSAVASALAGLRVVVSAGPTYEDIDPVRFIGNRSSGKMGFAVAEAAARRGAQVTLVAGPVALATPAGVRRVDVRSAAQMHAAVMAALPADIYVGAAAVADFAPAQAAASKIKKRDDRDGLVLELVRTRDILAEVAGHPQRPRMVVGFAAETDNVEGYARGKLARKRLDLIAANQVGREGGGFESDRNTLLVFGRDGSAQTLGPAGKGEVADGLLDVVERFWAASPG
ncbi:phosphopantothenoylcysteine decarboxylase/phosphopantothenate--cysteine ligase [Vulcaniibacterium tengchongense]|uniref:Phosphopantothenoylcysteine decarboxylase/phosphopantothenate--cysteine ligase n=1 Tax=Vulcaniibacterium tengchongense TaxID=1273429 RepID=A0A3N4V0N7_9GAMM|nr:phosphopantothenoylcysteine decarboxylase/phosphopantothenate--cysteine ligase [Vulcaniibacterium tengchongense]